MAERRLSQTKLGGGAGKTAFSGDGDKDKYFADVVAVHLNKSFLGVNPL
jgi:hypothetical protein